MKPIKQEPRIYLSQDGRLRITYYDKKENKYKTKSYPKYLMENLLQRELSLNEDVHHIDGNPLNNNINNLQIRLKGEHQREHVLNNNIPRKYPKSIIVKCGYCKKEFEVSPASQSSHINKMITRNRSSKYFCSKQCIGKYGSDIQNNRILIKNPFEKILFNY